MSDLEKDFNDFKDAYKAGDYPLARKICEALAKKNHALAQYNMGLMYDKGSAGVPQHYIRAHMWFNLSASNGYEDAVIARDNLEKNLTPEQIERAQDLAVEQIKPRPRAGTF